jgi:hypothetical protein
MKRLFVLIPALLVAGTVHAQEGKRTYGVIEYGVTRIENQAAEFGSFFLNAVGGSVAVTQDTSAGIGRLLFGLRISPQTAFEFGYFSSQKFGARVAGTSGAGNAYTSTLDIKTTGFDVAFVWSPMAVNYGDSGLYLKAGAHSSKVEFDWTISGAGGTAPLLSSKDSGVGTVFGAGYDWRLADNAFIKTGVNRYLKLGGDSDLDATVYSVGVGINF